MKNSFKNSKMNIKNNQWALVDFGPMQPKGDAP
jgi:hypothetical protein